MTIWSVRNYALIAADLLATLEALRCDLVAAEGSPLECTVLIAGHWNFVAEDEQRFSTKEAGNGFQLGGLSNTSTQWLGAGS